MAVLPAMPTRFRRSPLNVARGHLLRAISHDPELLSSVLKEWQEIIASADLDHPEAVRQAFKLVEVCKEIVTGESSAPAQEEEEIIHLPPRPMDKGGERSKKKHKHQRRNDKWS